MIILLVLLLFIGTVISECPPGTEYICQMNSCLAIIQNGTKHGAFQATVDCRSMGGNLTSIHSRSENNIVLVSLHSDTVDGNAYIGGVRKNREWTWTDGSVMNYTNWAGGEPTEGDDCIQMSRRQGKWITADCSERNVSYFCSIPYTPPTTTAAPPACSSGWTMINRNCYYFKDMYPSLVTRSEARLLCLASGGDLASIHSSEENRFLTKFPQSGVCRTAWIGLQWNKGYSWSDGSSVSFNNATRHEQTPPLGYYLWPSCINDERAGRWDDYTTSLYSFICKRKPTSSTLLP